MPNIEQLELWAKYEKEIDFFISLKKLSDEILFEAIINCSELITGYADNVKHFAGEGSLVAIEDSLRHLGNAINNMSITTREAKERAELNGQ